jgi:hypothetical protein
MFMHEYKVYVPQVEISEGMLKGFSCTQENVANFNSQKIF